MDRFDEMAKIAGEAAGLKPEQFSGLAHILRQVAKDEREACTNEIYRLRALFRVNMLRLAPQTSHDEIDALLKLSR